MPRAYSNPRPLTQADCDRLRRLREAGHSFTYCAIVMHRQKGTLRQCAKRGFTPTDWSTPKQCPVPGDFAIFAAKLTVDELAAHYDVAATTARRWVNDTGRTPVRKRDQTKLKNYRHCPPDFVEVYSRLGFTATMRHYRTGVKAMMRWKAEHGLPNPRGRKPQAPPAEVVSIARPAGYDAFKRKLGRVPSLYEVAA